MTGFWELDRIQVYCLPPISFFLKAGAFSFGGDLGITPLLEAAVVDYLG